VIYLGNSAVDARRLYVALPYGRCCEEQGGPLGRQARRPTERQADSKVAANGQREKSGRRRAFVGSVPAIGVEGGGVAPATASKVGRA
jgi:hypothetical protein